jgi:hypothetical protein
MSNILKSSAAALAVLLLACSSSNTAVVSSWKDPTAPARDYKKVLAVFITSDAAVRRTAEDELARKIGGGTPSYLVLPDSVLRDGARAKAIVQQQGFDGAVIMRPVALDKETSYVPGSAYAVPVGYRSMWGYWGTGWGYAYEPGHYTQDKVVYIESNVYSIADEKLVWSSRTKTYNPENVKALVDDIVDQFVAEMKRQGVFTG